MNERDYQDRTILVLGGASGIGLKDVADFARAGAHVYMGTRKPSNFDKALQRLANVEKLDVGSLAIHPFYADVTDSKQIREAVAGLKEKEPDLTDVIFSQAGGMEGFIQPLFKKHLDSIAEYTYGSPINELSEDHRAIVEEKLTAMRTDLEDWTAKALNNGVAVNYQGTFDVIDVLINTFPHGFRGIFYNSTWGHLSGREGMEIPLVYRPVDCSKALVRNRLRHEGTQLKQKGIPIGVIVASLVNDTQVGKMFNDFFLNLMDPDQREAVRESSITTSDVVYATRSLLNSDSERWPRYPYTRFVYRKNGQIIIEDQLELSPMYTKPYRF